MKKVLINEGTLYTQIKCMENGECLFIPATDSCYIGDVNPMEHGGTLILKEQGTEDSYNLLIFHPCEEEDGYACTSDAYVGGGNLEDLDCEESVKSYVGKEGEWENIFERINAYVSYLGAIEFGSQDVEYWESEEELGEMLGDYFGYSISIV